MFQLLHMNKESTIQPNVSLLNTIPFAQISVIDISFVPTKDNTIFEWCDLVRDIYIKALTLATRFRLLIAWIPEVSFSSSIKTICLSTLQDSIPTDWVLHCSLAEAQHHGDQLEANRFVISIMPIITAPSESINLIFQHD